MTEPSAPAEPGGPDLPAGTGDAATASAASASAGGQGQPSGRRQPLTGTAIIKAVTEGSPVVITILAIFTALVFGALLIVLSDPVVLRAWDSLAYAPGAALSATWTSVSAAYSALFEGAVFSPATVAAAFHGGSIAAIFYPLSLTVFEATPLILTGLSVALAFRAGMFNIGAAGQWVGGAVVATWLGTEVSLPLVIHAVVCVVGAFIGGAVIGWIVGELKARTGAHEVILTIMLNYVMYNLLSYLLSQHSLLQAPHQSELVASNLAGNAMLPHVGGPPPQAGVGFAVAIAAAVGVAWLLARSTWGFQFRTVGTNPSAARAAGMRVERVWVLAFLLAGGLAGLSAATLVQGQSQPLTFNSYGTYGFDGITVALLGRAKPLGVVLAGLLFGALNGGGTVMEAATGVPSDVVDVIKGLIVLFVAAPPLIRLLFRLRRTSAGPVAARGWTP